MAEEIVGVKVQVDTGDGVKKVGDIRKELKEIKKELVNLDEGSARFKQLSARAGELTDKMGDVGQRIRNLSSDTRGLDTVVQGVQGVIGAFTAFQGALALAGVENENVQKSIQKVQGSLALLNGVQSVANVLNKDSALMINLNATAQKVMAVSTNLSTRALAAFGVAATGSSVALKVLRTAIITTGIGALVVGVGLLIDKMSSLTDATNEQADAQKRLNDEITKFAKAGLDGELKSLEGQERLQKAQAKAKGASEEEIFQIEQSYRRLRAQAQIRYHEEVKNTDTAAAKEAKAEVDKLNADGIEAELDFRSKKNKIASDKAKQANDKAKEQAKQRLQTEKEALAELRKLAQENELNSIADENKRAKRRIEIDFENAKAEIAAKEISEDLKRKQLMQARMKSADEFAALELQIENQQKEAEAARIAAQQNQVNGENPLKIGGLTEQQLEQQRTLAQRLLDEGKTQFQLRLEAISRQEQEELKLVGDNEALKTQVITNAAKARKAVEQEESDFKLSLLSNTLGKASEILGKETVAGKALAIAEATINTYLGATQILRAPSPLPGPLAVASKIIGAAAIVANGIKTVKQITAVKVPGSGGGGAAPNMGAPLSPAMSPQALQTQLQQQQINDKGNAMLKAYVVEKDLKKAQDRIYRVQSNAKIGGK